MAITDYERVGKAMELLRDGLLPYVERECRNAFDKYWVSKVSAEWSRDLDWPEGADLPNLDAAPLLRIMWEQWNQVFRNTLGFAERSLVSELREVRRTD